MVLHSDQQLGSLPTDMNNWHDWKQTWRKNGEKIVDQFISNSQAESKIVYGRQQKNIVFLSSEVVPNVWNGNKTN